MPYLNLDLNYREHPKTRRLVAILGPEGDIYPIRLWLYCGKIHPRDGALMAYSAKEIEGLIGWNGEPGVAVEALKKVGFILDAENGFLCNDWREHEGHLIAFSRRARRAAIERWSKHATSIAKKETSNAPSVPSVPTKKNPLPPFGFDTFWAVYPNKKAKGGAEKIWARIAPDDKLLEVIIKAVKQQRTSEQWRNGFIPHPTTWLNQRRWEDEPDVTITQDLPNQCRKCMIVHPGETCEQVAAN